MATPRAALRAVATAAARRPAPIAQFSVLSRGGAMRPLALASDLQRALLRQYSASPRLWQAGGAPGAGSGDKAAAGAGADAAKDSKEQAAEEEQYADEAYDADEPLAARISRYIWTTIKYSFGIGLVGLVFYAGYTIVVTLLPGGSSANAIMRHAADVLRADPEIHAVFGSGLKSYGEDFGARNEGRRYYVPEYTYTDDWDGQAYTRVRFHLEGERQRKGIAWAEVRQGTYDFRYLIVMARDKSRVWTVIDNRRQPPSTEERQARLSAILAEHNWVFYADGDGDERGQAEALGGEYFSKVKRVRCDLEPAACDAAGVLSRPAWTTHKSGEVLKGSRSLRDLEEATREVAHTKKAWYKFW